MAKMLITGNEAIVKGAIDAGAHAMFGYPITPSCEILSGWITNAETDKKHTYLQTEDETAAGFGVIGALLAGKKAFTATAGPGSILMQDPLSMAENMRLPFVVFFMQRGGPSTGTVNFSQQEVNLAAFGGNGDGLRVVYSAGSVTELYELAIKAFDTAWKYRFPTIVLGDGYLGKMTENIEIKKNLNPINPDKILKEEASPTHLRNCYSSEESFGQVLKTQQSDWNKNRSKIVEFEKFKTEGAKEIIIAHGLVATAAKEAITELRKSGKKIGLFRPITLNPFPKEALLKLIQSNTKLYLFESSKDQFAHIVKYETHGIKNQIKQFAKPAEGFTAAEIINLIRG